MRYLAEAQLLTAQETIPTWGGSQPALLVSANA